MAIETKRPTATWVAPLVVGLCALAFFGRLWAGADLALYDFFYRVRGDLEPSPAVVIVGIDQRSLARVGRWPWSRDAYVPLLEAIAAAEPRTIGLGVLFQDDPDQAAAGHDATLGSTVAELGNVIVPFELAAIGTRGGGSTPPPAYLEAATLPRSHVSGSLGRMRQAAELYPTTAAIAEGAAGWGHLNFLPDPDGVYRACPTLVAHGERAYPAFGLAIARHFQSGGSEAITTGDGVVRSSSSSALPVDDEADLTIAFTGGAEHYPVVSAVDVLEGSVLPETFRNKAVLIGATDPTLAASVATPTTSRMASVDLHAHVIDGFLTGRAYSRGATERLIDTVVFVVVALVAGLLLPRLGPTAGAVTAAGLAFAVLGGALAAFLGPGAWLQPFYPVLAIALAYLVSTALSFRRAESEKERAQAGEREAQTMLGLSFQEKGMLDLAMQAYSRVDTDDDMKEIYYSLASDYENRGEREKAFAALKRISDQDPDYRDVATRMQQLRATGLETRMVSTEVRESVDEDASTPPADTAPPRPAGVEDRVPLRRFGRYEVYERLGRGAMGEVYLGCDPRIGRMSAIKTIRLTGDADARETIELKQRFYREARTAGRLSHPNIVTIYDVDEDAGVAFIVMELLDGIELSEVIRRRPKMKQSQVRHIIAQVADALAYAHGQGIVHRDVKPGNIMLLKRELQVKVMDFGIARLAESTMTATGSVLGTPAYMSPEQIRGEKVDGRADVFSLGVVLYELLTFERPFAGDVGTLMYQILNDSPKPAAELRSGLHRHWQAVIDRALAKSPDARFQDADAFARAVRQVGTAGFSIEG